MTINFSSTDTSVFWSSATAVTFFQQQLSILV